LVTTHPGVFAGGDAVTGPATAVKAIAAGKQAASSIDLYLRGETFATPEQTEKGETQDLPQRILEKTRSLQRCQVQALPVKSRLAGFDEVASELTQTQATQEALRCLHCSLGAHLDEEQCIACGACVKVCPLEIPTMNAEGKVDIDLFECQACGTCVAECPVQAINATLCPLGEIVSEVESTLDRSQPADLLVVGMFCQYGNFTKIDLDALRRDYAPIVPIMIFGLERVSVSDLLRTFQMGADAVLMAEAPTENRLFANTQPLVKTRTEAAKEILDLLGLGGDRLISYTMPQDGLFEASWLADTMEKIKALGPNPLRRESLAA
jgi:coenzyme F420-reducing hydrogenase delta subunit/Pyruvate/2-oxoacid:ferredoxin oxidoreductase delta subunit